MEAISGRKTIQEIAADHAIHPIQVSQWKRQLLDDASELFTRGKKSKDQNEGQVPGVNYVGGRVESLLMLPL
jgi:putative transposase